MTGFIYPLLLVCVGFAEVLSHLHDCDPMLGKIASDVVEDVVHFLVSFSKDDDAHHGAPVVDGFLSSFSLAGIQFLIEADVGTFLGFPSLHTTSRTNLSHIHNDPKENIHRFRLTTQVSFRNFAIHYKNVSVSVQDARWNGDLTVKVRKNEFLTPFSVNHVQDACEVTLDVVETLQYTDADVELKMDGFPKFHLSHVENKVKDGVRAYESLVVSRLFDFYLTPRVTASGLVNPLTYCTFVQDLPSINTLVQKRKNFRIFERPLRESKNHRMPPSRLQQIRELDSFREPYLYLREKKERHLVKMVDLPGHHSESLEKGHHNLVGPIEPREEKQNLPVGSNEPSQKMGDVSIRHSVSLEKMHNPGYLSAPLEKKYLILMRPNESLQSLHLRKKKEPYLVKMVDLPGHLLEKNHHKLVGLSQPRGEKQNPPVGSSEPSGKVRHYPVYLSVPLEKRYLVLIRPKESLTSLHSRKQNNPHSIKIAGIPVHSSEHLEKNHQNPVGPSEPREEKQNLRPREPSEKRLHIPAYVLIDCSKTLAKRHNIPISHSESLEKRPSFPVTVSKRLSPDHAQFLALSPEKILLGTIRFIAFFQYLVT